MRLNYPEALNGVTDEASQVVLVKLVEHVKNWGDFPLTPYLRATVLVNLIDEIKRLKEDRPGYEMPEDDDDA